MKVFISWSGNRSQAVAKALRDWLPNVIQQVKPWMSKLDIKAGERWGPEISKALDEINFGILCLTEDNLGSPWLNFEAGAIAKRLDISYVVPYLVHLNPADIPSGPLSQFQAKRSNKEETFEIISSINEQIKENKLTDEKLRGSFEKWWPDLEKEISDIPEDVEIRETKERTQDVKLDELLEITRDLKRMIRQAVSIPEVKRLSDLVDDDILEIASRKKALKGLLKDKIESISIASKLLMELGEVETKGRNALTSEGMDTTTCVHGETFQNPVHSYEPQENKK